MSIKQHLIIKNLGPIKNCEIDLTKMIVLDGPQAAGKSTVAKAIFFFRTVKNDTVDSLIKPLEKPAGYEELYRDWVSGKISARGAAKKLGLNHNTFLNWVRRHQQKK